MKKKSTENFQFLQLDKNLNITWACFRNVETKTPTKIFSDAANF